VFVRLPLPLKDVPRSVRSQFDDWWWSRRATPSIQLEGMCLVRAGRELGVRPQREASELPSAVRLLDLHARGIVAVCYDHDTGIGAGEAG
jgi:hypothetical protein